MSTNVRACANLLISPENLKKQLPLTEDICNDIAQWRQTIVDILNGKDPRTLLIMGPCSVHDPIAVVAYAKKLVTISQDEQDRPKRAPLETGPAVRKDKTTIN